MSERTRPAAIDETALWEAYAQRIHRYLLRLTGNRETAEDLTQETFARAIRDLRRARRPVEHESAWIFRIATNLFRDHYRRHRLIAWLPFLHRELESVTVSDEAADVARRELVGQALRRLAPDTRALLLLRDGEGFSTRELAEAMGLEYEAARKRLARARLQFREEYRRLGGDEA